MLSAGTRPAADVRIPQRRAAPLALRFGMRMPGALVAGRLVAVDACGQPGVEACERHTNDILRGKNDGNRTHLAGAW